MRTIYKQTMVVAASCVAFYAFGACAPDDGTYAEQPEDELASEPKPTPDGEAHDADASRDYELGSTDQALADQCGHSICETGAAVRATCDTCAQRICATDSFCCSNSWDAVCVREVSTICGLGGPQVTANTVVTSIKARIKTGGDDLRGGSQAYGTFQITGGGSLAARPLNGGAGWGNNSVNVATIPLSPGRSLGSLIGFTLSWDGAPRNLFDTYDNWNADQIRFFVGGDDGRCPTFIGPTLAPGRMTGSRTTATSAVRFP